MKVFLSHSFHDSVKISEIRRALSQRQDEVIVSEQGEGPAEIAAKIRSADVIVVYLVQPESATFVELGIALGAGRSTILFGTVGEPSIVDAFDLPCVTPTGSDALDAQAIAGAIDRAARPAVPSVQPSSLAVLASEPTAVDAVDHNTFESLVMKWLTDLGASVERAPRGHGADLRFVYGGGAWLVEIKKLLRQARVSVEAVRAFDRSVHLSGSLGGIMVTSSPLTKAAESVASDSSVAVFSVPELVAESSLEDLLATAANKALHLPSSGSDAPGTRKPDSRT